MRRTFHQRFDYVQSSYKDDDKYVVVCGIYGTDPAKKTPGIVVSMTVKSI